MREKARKSPRPDEQFEIWTEVTGVLGPRREIVERYCRAGSPLHIRPEPDNPHDSNAMAVGVIRKGYFRSMAHQIGYLPREDAREVKQHLDRGWTTDAWVFSIKVSADDWLYVNINVVLRPPGPVKRTEPSQLDPPPKDPVKPAEILRRFKPRINIVLPETWRQRGVLAATVLLAEGAALIVLGIVVGLIVGRHSDILSLGVLSAAIGAGMWGLALVAKVK